MSQCRTNSEVNIAILALTHKMGRENKEQLLLITAQAIYVLVSNLTNASAKQSSFISHALHSTFPN